MTEDSEPKYQVDESRSSGKVAEHILDLKNTRVSSLVELKVLFEKIPDFRNSFSKDIERDLEEEEFASKAWRECQEIDSKDTEEVYQDIAQYECNTCSDNHYHTKKKMTIDEHGGYEFSNPVPNSMREILISDLSSVEIDWRMMTSLRPESKLDEDLFTRLVQLDGLCRRARVKEHKLYSNVTTDPDRTVKLPSESKGGMIQVFFQICDECSEEFCYGECKKFLFEDSKRMSINE